MQAVLDGLGLSADAGRYNHPLLASPPGHAARTWLALCFDREAPEA
jgi:hypothetical protein